MKKLSLVVICLLSLFFAKAQAPCAVFYTELGERFTVYIDGIAQHQYSEPNVKILDFSGLSYNVTIKFENGFIEDVNKSINLANGTESSFMIHKKQGRYDLSPKNQIPLAQASRSANTNSQQVVTFRGKTNVTTTTTSTNYNDGSNSNVNMGVTGDGGNVSVNVSVSDNNNNSNGTVNTSVGVKSSGGGKKDNSGNSKGGNKGNGTVTSTSTSGNNNSSVGTKAGGGQQNNNTSASGNSHLGNQKPKPISTTTTTTTTTDNRPSGYNGRMGCSNPMSSTAFAQAKESVQAKNFSNAQVTVAKQIADANCLLVSQIKELMKIFDFEEAKLDFAKYAYKHACDIDNYYQVNDAFDFEGSVTKLDEYIKSIK